MLVDLTGFSPGVCDMVFVRDETSSPAFTCVFVCDFEKVPPSCAWPLVLALRTGPLPLLRLVRLCAFGPAALLPAPIEEPVPAAPVEVPPVPSEVADVPPAAAEPPVPPVALPPAAPPPPIWAKAAVDRLIESPRAMIACLRILVSYGELVLIVQPLTVTVPAEADTPEPPPVVVELDTDPLPARTFTDEPPADELLDTLPALEELDPPPELPLAVMLPSA